MIFHTEATRFPGSILQAPYIAGSTHIWVVPTHWQGRELKNWRNLRGFPKPENAREGRSVTIQRKRFPEASIASKMWDRHTRSYNRFMCLPASKFGQKLLPKGDEAGKGRLSGRKSAQNPVEEI